MNPNTKIALEKLTMLQTKSSSEHLDFLIYKLNIDFQELFFLFKRLVLNLKPNQRGNQEYISQQLELLEDDRLKKIDYLSLSGQEKVRQDRCLHFNLFTGSGFIGEQDSKIRKIFLDLQKLINNLLREEILKKDASLKKQLETFLRKKNPYLSQDNISILSKFVMSFLSFQRRKKITLLNEFQNKKNMFWLRNITVYGFKDLDHYLEKLLCFCDKQQYFLEKLTLKMTKSYEEDVSFTLTTDDQRKCFSLRKNRVFLYNLSNYDNEISEILDKISGITKVTIQESSGISSTYILSILNSCPEVSSVGIKSNQFSPKFIQGILEQARQIKSLQYLQILPNKGFEYFSFRPQLGIKLQRLDLASIPWSNFVTTCKTLNIKLREEPDHSQRASIILGRPSLERIGNRSSTNTDSNSDLRPFPTSNSSLSLKE